MVDQGSKDGSVEMLKKEYPKVKSIFLPENVGIPKGSNLGIEKSKGEFIFLMGNDTIVSPDWIESTLRVMQSDPKIASVGSTLVHPKEALTVQPTPIDLEMDTVCSAAMLMKRKACDHIGLYDAESFSPYGGDETDWNYRCRGVGYKVIETRRSIVGHIGGADTALQNPRAYYLMNRGRLRAMLYNDSFVRFLKRIPGLGLIFLQSLKDGQTIPLLQSYWDNLVEWKMVERKRRERNEIRKHCLEEQKMQSTAWW